MSVSAVALTEEECYLVALLEDDSGIDLAEFLWEDATADNAEQLFRAWEFQIPWWRNSHRLFIDTCARAVGKTQSIILRAWAFPLQFPGFEMVVTAPELVHLNPLTSRIEDRIKGTRLTKELLPGGVGRGFTHRPFQANFKNGAKILGRIPQKDGKGVKGCVAEGTLVLAARGHVPVEDLLVGELVATHTGAWKPITSIQVDETECYEVTGSQSYPLVVSNDHSFYGARNHAGPKRKRQLDELAWFDVEDLDDVYWASPRRFAALDIPQPVFAGTARRFELGREFWWLTGRYLADGFVSRDHKTGKSRKVSWVVHPTQAQEIEKRLDLLGFSYRRRERSHSSADVIEVGSAPWERWLVEHFGHRSYNKVLPGFVFGMDELCREELLDGYLSGDGHYRLDKMRWDFSSASQGLAQGLQLLGQTLGYTGIASSVVPTSQFTDTPRVAWRVGLTTHGHPYTIDEMSVAKVKRVVSVGRRRVFNPQVADDHSYVSGTIVSHNLHPLRLEMDEAQDFPEPGWTELVETLRYGQDDAQWRAHGVSKGVGGRFQAVSQPGSGWAVERITAMHRLDWSDQERKDKAALYGGRDAPDYLRNILGLHGDATNPLFVLHRLMACVDNDEGSVYNQDVYYHRRINDEILKGDNIVDLLDIPRIHLTDWKIFWMGMDVGLTNHPSEILIFGEETLKMRGYEPRVALRLLSRVHLRRIRAADQRAAIAHLVRLYKPTMFAIDRTGLGHPVYQDLQDENPDLMEYISGYAFNEKIVVGWEAHEEGDDPKDFEIKRVAQEHAYDLLRTYVDGRRLILPFDTDLLGEWNGQTWTRETASTRDAYGRKRFSQGNFHTLDAGGLAVLAKEMSVFEKVQQMTAEREPIGVVWI